MERRQFIKLFAALAYTPSLLELPDSEIHIKDIRSGFRKIAGGDIMIQWGATSRQGHALFPVIFAGPALSVIAQHPLRDSPVAVLNLSDRRIQLSDQALYVVIGLAKDNSL